MIETTEFIDEITPTTYACFPHHKALADAVAEAYGIPIGNIERMVFGVTFVRIHTVRTESWSQGVEPFRTFAPDPAE